MSVTPNAAFAQIGEHEGTSWNYANDNHSPRPWSPNDVKTASSGTLFGIDIATSQHGINLTEFRQGGGQFAIIKMGGGNASDSPYESPYYREQLAGARAAGLPVGHYWFNGMNGERLSPFEQGRFFAHHADVREGDLVALDVEDEPDTGTSHFTPQQSKEWIEGVRQILPGIKVLIYANASVIRHNDWSEVANDGNPLWYAWWGDNDGSLPPMPQPPAYWSEWAVWQYSSNVLVAGFGQRVDANIARPDLFDRYGWRGSR